MFLKHFITYVVLLSFVTAFLVSCVHPVQASAESYADEFNEALITELERYQSAYDVAFASHVLTPEVPVWAMALEFYGIMNTYEYLNFKYFDDTENINPSYAIQETNGASGIYNTGIDGVLTTRFGSVMSPSSFGGGVCALGQDFICEYTYEFADNVDISGLHFEAVTDQPGQTSLSGESGKYKTYKWTDTFKGVSTSHSRRSSSGNFVNGYRVNSNSAPTLNSIPYYDSIVIGYGSDYILPSGSITREEPWNYYNDLVDDCHEKYGDTEEVNEWLPWHGQKWVPGHVGPMDPTEPARPNPVDLPFNLPVVPYVPGIPTEIPVEIDTNGTTEIYEVYSPTTNQITINGIAFIIGAAGAFGAAGAAGAAGGIYANGQVSIGGELFDIPSFDLPIDGFDVPISIPDSSTIQLGDLEFHFNSDGTITIGDMTFNLPLGEPETVEVGADTYLIEYELPTFESLYVPAETVPQISLSNYYDGISLMWEAVYDLLDNTGFLPLVYIMFGMGVVAFILWKIGG